MRFELFVAARYLRAKRRQAVVGVVTSISIAGVAAGVAALIIALAITNGMRRDLEDRLVDTTAHVELMRVQADGIRDWQPLIERLRKLPHIAAAAPGLYEQVLVARGARDGGALVEGILPDQEMTVSSLLKTATPGAIDALRPQTQPASPTQLPPVVLGKDLADTIGATVGDKVTLISPQGELTPYGVIPKWVPFRLAGTYHSGFYQYDSQMGFIRLADAQRLFDEPDVLSVISFKVDDLNRAPQIAREIEQAAGKGFQTTNWEEQNRELFRALRLEQYVTFIVIALIVVVAALNILIALTMMVMEKTRDIAVLMSFGVAPEQVRRIFLLQGLLISIVGTLLGLVLGYVASWAGGHYHIPLSPDVYSIDTLPFAPRIVDGIIVAAVSIGISLLATLYPSHTAARILPAEALRYE
ncbi:MAG TPA: FtsX-like permease family protein [Terracidiphilus sp.]|nr:FtsX-like permease family protein [Terracidiphilus sp.]HYK64930.1 FtsX-like permease family protein [Patescibacteria group bacterium]